MHIAAQAVQLRNCHMASERPRGRESCLELRTTIQRVSTFAGLDFQKFTGDLESLGEMAKRLSLGFDPKP